MACHGADLRHTRPTQLGSAVNMVLPEHRDEISRQLAKEIELGWLTTTPPFQGACKTRNAPIFAKEEPGKLRRITDYSDKASDGTLRGPNGYVDKDTLGDAPMDRPLRLAKAIRTLTKRDGAPPLLLVRDISKAYRRIAVRKEDIPHLHTVWQGLHMWDTRLPFGHAAAAHHCCKLTAAIAAAFTKYMCGRAIALAYVDDFIVVCGRQHTQEAEALLHRMLDDVGMPITPEKAAAAGTWNTSADWIGYRHDTVRGTHALKPDKVPELKALIGDTLGERRVQPRRLKRLVGKLNHVANIHHPARAHMQALVRSCRANKPTVLDRDACDDLKWWSHALETMPNEAKMAETPNGRSLCIATDASLSGIGAVLHATRRSARSAAAPLDALAAPFTQRHEPRDMMLLEAAALYASIAHWAPRLAGSVVWLQLDNQALVWAMRRGRSKCRRSNDVLKHIFAITVRHRLKVVPFHVKSEDNGQADALSRQWEPCPSTCALDHTTPTTASWKLQNWQL